MRWREQDDIRWLEAELPGAKAAFSTRLGGLSDGPHRSLNLGVLTGDDRSLVLGNRRRLDAALGIEGGSVLVGRQVHGAAVHSHDRAQGPAPWLDPGAPGADPPEVDGHATAVPGLTALVLVADCLPIALSGRTGVAMIHGGWRGLAGGIVGAGAGAVGATAAVIGPGIGPCCYEVGDEVLDAFAPLGRGLADGRMLDLKAVAARLLERAGVEAVEDAGLCTSCDPELFFSHRGQGPDTGRQAGLVRMLAP
ncbi:MAG: laccase domain-containing protein [Solirubrobacterales bacterium]|nr:laccase domain-containing protein [Solirubrobacterales bacterium]